MNSLAGRIGTDALGTPSFAPLVLNSRGAGKCWGLHFTENGAL